MAPVLVVPIPPAPFESLAFLRKRISDIFHVPVSVDSSRPIDPAFAFDASRNQYYSTLLLSALVRAFDSAQTKILAVTTADLYVPVLTYVFGEAQLGGSAAIISTHRLDNRVYGLPEDPAILEGRMVKEAVHELGHAFGLVHCRNFECVMHSSTGVEEIDLKSPLFCGECLCDFNQWTGTPLV